MPLYEFFCFDCSQKFERLTTYAVSAKADGVICPTCQGTHVRKLFSVFARAGRGGDDDSDYGESVDFGGCSCGGACSCGGH
jgi:putative FmdB family regulatory protein